MILDDFDLVEPSASPILESLRAFGYTPQTALADIIDNSISAGASSIEVSFVWDGNESRVLVVDDGRGMDQPTLVDAMRLGSRSPVAERSAGDLGRFGLGLKTASFSQGRELTVASRPLGGDGQITVRRWDLDEVQKTNEWRLFRDAPPAISEELESLLPSSGTVIAWGNLDRMLDKVYGADVAAGRPHFNRIIDDVSQHLELVFHRFLNRAKPIRISVNGQRLNGWDPFLTKHASTWSPGPETLPLAGESIEVQAYVLPHKSKLTESEHEAAAGQSGWNASQGFYVYREDRLLVAGSWLGVGGVKEEHSKLARISLNVPSKLDHLWQVDVRKSSIKPPGPILADLRRIAKLAKRSAQEAYRFRGKANSARVSQDFVIAWESFRVRGGINHYRVNRKHPIVDEALSGTHVDARSIERLIRFIEETLPVTQIGIAVADSLDDPFRPFEDKTLELRDQLEYMHTRLVHRGRTQEESLQHLAAIEPFSYYPDVVQAFREALE